LVASEGTAMLKLSTYAWVVILVTLSFGVSIAVAGYHYYVVPRTTYLRILYTHSSQMINEIAANFTTWYEEEYGARIEVTTTLVTPQTAYQKAMSIRDPEADIWWGGPPSFFESAYSGLSPYNSTYKDEINETCHFSPLMDLKHYTPSWYAASLCGLGLMYNERSLSLLGLPKPQNWTALLDEGYEGQITMVAPSNSKLLTSFISLILQTRMFTTNGFQNWTLGWEYLVRLSALVEKYDKNEMESALKIASGYKPLAILPDFYAYEKMLYYPNLKFTYLDATLLQPDPIAIFKKSTYLNEARAFVDFILTQQAQNIIGKYLLPIRQETPVTPPRINPFIQNFPFIKDYNETFSGIGRKILEDYYQVWITERHEQIRDAWTEIKQADKTSDYYALLWHNFTYVGRYMNRSEVDVLYNQTNGWTENVIAYIVEWQTASGSPPPQYMLTVNIVGNGSVEKNPDQAIYTYGTSVQLTATADPDWTFSYWSDGLTGSTNPDTIIMDGDKTVTAYFMEDLSAFRVVSLRTNMGDIIIELYDDMPITTGNFKNLVHQGVYDGTIFHRVIYGFMIQGGDPTGTGYGDPSIPTIPDEFTDHNRNDRGTIAMANAGPNTGSSQFFINLVDNNYLDSDHPVFGEVIEGMDVVDSIADVATDENDRPLQDVIILEAELIG
jgi:peptidylprolyl isomerase